MLCFLVTVPSNPSLWALLKMTLGLENPLILSSLFLIICYIYYSLGKSSAFYSDYWQADYDRSSSLIKLCFSPRNSCSLCRMVIFSIAPSFVFFLFMVKSNWRSLHSNSLKVLPNISQATRFSSFENSSGLLETSLHPLARQCTLTVLNSLMTYTNCSTCLINRVLSFGIPYCFISCLGCFDHSFIL